MSISFGFLFKIEAYSRNSSRNISDFLAILHLDMGSQYETGLFFLLNVRGGGGEGRGGGETRNVDKYKSLMDHQFIDSWGEY